MKRVIFLIALGGLVSFSSCKKEAGTGGTSSIMGNVSGRIYSSSGGNNAEAEVTDIVLPSGANLADGEYILLNTPVGGGQYYVWFKWNNGVQPDPLLNGRTGIQVTFDFTETNTEVATNMAAAITAAASADFSVQQNNDIVTITNLIAGEVTDADELTSNVLIDVSNQGQSAISGGTSYVEGPIVDERVYLRFGDDDFYSESVRTDASGNYQFTGLNRGNYTVYAISADTLNPSGILTQVETNVEIAEKKEVVKASDLFVVQY